MLANEADSIEPKTSTVPISSVGRVPSLRFESDTRGDTSRACDIDSPPIKAYCSSVAPGKVEFDR